MSRKPNRPLTCVEICTGAGGQALGLSMAGFHHVILVEYEQDYCNTLKRNRPEWNVVCDDVRNFSGIPYNGVDLFAAGVPCPPFSAAGAQEGENDERDLFPEAIRLIREIKPKAFLIENVRGILNPKFDDYRKRIYDQLTGAGYNVSIDLYNACDYGVPQLRPRVVFVGIKNSIRKKYVVPEKVGNNKTVGEALYDLMSENGWRGAKEWERTANKIAPTLVGGSKKHGGPDLGPTRARKAWLELGVDGSGIANHAPEKDYEGIPKLTVRMAARIQGFPDEWVFDRRKTTAYRMIGNAFPPPVAYEIGKKIRECIE